ncbi:unnamed protein product [Gongylonema pulchrum]|uniref:GOLGA2L5 domain-containing protein n=1 Tax=Gongylonema pulchrum TaxID=637853 RepID=A0A183CXE9_9BILA|nr:unnamed protein product [Gongylonema pulchrum]
MQQNSQTEYTSLFDVYQNTHYSALKAQLEEVQRELDGKNDILGCMEKAKNDAEWNLGEHKQWLTDANEKYAHISVLLSITKAKVQINKDLKELNGKNDLMGNLEKAKNDAEWNLGEHRQCLADANESALKAQLEKLQEELNVKNDVVGDLEKAKNDAEWNLDEHKQWLADANQRYLQYIELLHRLQQVQITIEEESGSSALKAQLEEMQEELNGKNDLMGNLEKAKNDAEWSLGEHRQWLADANERSDHLDALCHEKERAIQDLENRLREAEQNASEKANAEDLIM